MQGPSCLGEEYVGWFSNDNTRSSGEGEVGKVGVGTDCTITPIRLGGFSIISSTDMFYPVVEDLYMMLPAPAFCRGLRTQPKKQEPRYQVALNDD